MNLRDRIVETKRVPAKDIAPNPANWRVHPTGQRNRLRALLAEIGIARSVVAYHSERNGGKLTLIDGHLRTEEIADNAEIPVEILDVNDDEADVLLLSLDPLAEFAGKDEDAYNALAEAAAAKSEAARAMLEVEKEPVPDFQPVPEETQSRLDQKDPITCPECGHEFTP